MEVEKRPGYDWHVTYIDQSEDKPEQETMAVFGAKTVDDALKDARSSFRKQDLEYITIISITRRT